MHPEQGEEDMSQHAPLLGNISQSVSGVVKGRLNPVDVLALVSIALNPAT